jgi:predicted MFS family arabinose efflux permease
MLIVLLLSRLIKESKSVLKPVRIDLASVALSASGMALLIFGILQSKTWGWIVPKSVPQIGSLELAPLGISLVAYLILLGAFILRVFVERQRRLETANSNPLLKISLFSIKALRSGLAVLSAQYLITAAVFFILPIYLQMVLGLDALATGKKIFPLSVAIVAFSAIGSRLVSRYSPRRIVRIGQLALVAGSLLILGAINPELKGILFALGMILLGAGLGLLASQIGNVTMSSVPQQDSSEVGGLQGTFQNLGSSLGTALIGTVMVASLTTNFTNSLDSTSLPSNVVSTIDSKAQAGIPIVPAKDIESAATQQGLTQAEAKTLSNSYQESQIRSLKASVFAVAALGLLSIALSRNIPNQKNF